MNINATDPNTLLGFGTWARFGQGRMLVSQNSSDSDFDSGEETGGAKTHTLSEANLAAHSHLMVHQTGITSNSINNITATHIARGNNGGMGSSDYGLQGTSSTPNAGSTADTGSGSAVNHMNPYIVVYMWKRTA